MGAQPVTGDEHPDHDPPGGDRLGEDLRVIAELLATHAVDDATAHEVERHLAAARRALAATPAAPRWYESHPGDRAASRAHHDAFGPLRGRANVVAPPVVFGNPVERDGVTVVRATVHCGARYEGPPRVVHGGIVAACFDEVLAVTMRDAGIWGVTRELRVRYRRPVPVGTDLDLTAWIDHDDGTRATGRAECHLGEILCAGATAEFVHAR